MADGAGARGVDADAHHYDVIVIGAGLGGLLSAAQFLRRGRRVLVVERLAHPGGRFTAKTFQGAQVSTGAVHMVPFGTNGELAAMLRALGVPHRIFDAEVFASFHVRGGYYTCRSILQLASVLGARQFAEFVRLGAAMLLRAPRLEERTLTYRAWLERRISRARSPELYAYFERVCHFALSVDLDDMSYPEIVETTKNMFRYGPPGIVDGGCAALTGELERRVLAGGGALRLQQDVLAIEHDGRAVTGVRLRDKLTGEQTRLRAPLVVSNIGPEATRRLVGDSSFLDPFPTRGEGGSRDSTSEFSPAVGVEDGLAIGARLASPAGDGDAGRRARVASGLKVHLLSEESIIPHRGILYCLDTARIAGIVQPSNSDRRLAPPGKHLLITHQLLRSEDMNAEREAARADLRRLFGERFGTTIRILTMSQYRGEWPVNRAVQGEDAAPETPLAGLYLVGDAVKPSGYLMVEGVAQSVNALLDALDRMDQKDGEYAADGADVLAEREPAEIGAIRPTSGLNTPPKPPKRRAVHWLVAPPPPHRGS
jgi:phytoene dehydrogenase-like protein